MIARFFIHYVDPEGMPHKQEPSVEFLGGWYKEFRLEVDVDDKRCSSQHRTPMWDPRAHAPEFEKFIREKMAGDIGRLVADEIKGQICR